MSRVPVAQQNGALQQTVGGAPQISVIQTTPTTSAPSDEEQLSLRDIFAILGKRKWTILFTTLFTLLFALLFTFSTKPSYVAKATIQIEKEAPTVISFSPTQSQGAPDSLQDPFFRTRYEMLKSRSLAEIVVEQENLETSLRTSGEPPEAMKGFFSLFSVSKWLGTDKPKSDGAEAPQADITELFGQNLQIQPIESTHLVNIFYEGSSPNEAQRTVSSVISNFIQLQIDTKSETGEYAKNFLSQELDKARQNLQNAEKKLVQYSNANGILNIDSNQSRHVRKLNDLSSALVQAEIRRTAAESNFREMQNSGSVSTVLNNTVITNLKGRLVGLEADYQERLKLFKPGYPDMVRLNQQITDLRRSLNRELNTVKGSLESDFESARRQENKLRSELASFNRELYSLQGKGIDYNTLKREVDSSGALYNGLLQRVEETGISSAANANTSNISIIDPPREPVKKYRPNPKLNVMVGTIAGLLLGVGLAFLRDSLDQSIKSPADLEKYTGLSILSSIPKPDGAAKRNLALACKTAPDTQFAQAYRIFAANMKLQNHEEDQVLLVTSTMGEEGKSTTACNLACAYAQMGMRVLLIDADLRLPTIHKKIGIKNTTGLSDYLGNETDLVGITQTIKAIPNLFVITAGNLKAEPMQLLSSEKMAYLVAQASQRFDFVIMDSAPASGLAETLVLSSLATKTLMVADEKNMTTHAERIKRTVESLGRIKQNLSGFLVVNAKKMVEQQDHKYLQRSRQRNSNRLLGRA